MNKYVFIPFLFCCSFCFSAEINNIPDGSSPHGSGNRNITTTIKSNGATVRVTSNPMNTIAEVDVISASKSSSSYLLRFRSPSTIEGSLGQRSVGTVPAVFERKYAKSAVLKGVFTVGKQVAKRAVSLSPWVMGAWLAYDIYKEFAESDGFTKGEDGDFYKKLDTNGKDLWVIVASDSEYAFADIKTGWTYTSVDEFCSYNSLKCNLGVLAYTTDLSTSLSNLCTSYFESKRAKDKEESPDYVGDSFVYGAGGRCYSGRYSYGPPYFSAFKIRNNQVPFTQADFERLANDAADQAIEKYINASNVEPESTTATVPNGTVAYSNPFTDPADNKPKQTRWKFTQKPDGTTEVEELTLERPDLEPNSAAAPTINNNTNIDNSTTNNNENESSEEQKQDLCEKNPDSIACDKLGEPETPNLDIPEKTINLEFQKDNVLPEAGTCPEPVTFEFIEQTYSISLQPACDLARMLRPFLIAMAWFYACFFVVRTIQKEV